MKNGKDEGGSDFCQNCIDDAVKEARTFHKGKRAKILDKFKQIAETGGYKNGNSKIKIKDKYTQKQIAQSKKQELKEYPAKALFTYKGHDPDFGGGLHEPCTCEGCGQVFTCSFTPDIEEAERLLESVSDFEITERAKWELDIAFYNYDYTDDDVKLILYKVAGKVIENLSVTN